MAKSKQNQFKKRNWILKYWLMPVMSPCVTHILYEKVYYYKYF